MSGQEIPGTITILVVDDEPDLQDLYARRLEKAGFYVEKASCGDEAIAIISTKPCNAIICDINMPGKTGFDVFNHIRLEMGLRIPFLFVTGHGAGSTEMQKALTLGAEGVYSKPVSSKVLVERLHELCGVPTPSVS
jgi:chemosensory pili system protein ChpA (sensor histidine kinase/response regulator)